MKSNYKSSTALATIVILLIASTTVFAGTVKFHYDDANRMTRAAADDGTAFEHDNAPLNPLFPEYYNPYAPDSPDNPYNPNPDLTCREALIHMI